MPMATKEAKVPGHIGRNPTPRQEASNNARLFNQMDLFLLIILTFLILELKSRLINQDKNYRVSVYEKQDRLLVISLS